MTNMRPKSRRAKTEIIIIGNGFDLAHGYPTRYMDFIKSCNDPGLLEFEKIVEQYCKDDSLWSDFESAINQVTMSWFGNQLAYVEADFDKFQRDIYTINTLFEQIGKKLLNYLNEVTTGDASRQLISVREHIGKKAKVINFNYTNVAERYKKDIIYIHGSLLEKDIVLGYDFRNEPCLMQYDAMRWSKKNCRQLLAFRRHLREHLKLHENDKCYLELTDEMDRVMSMVNSSRGFGGSDWDEIQHADIIRPYAETKTVDEQLPLPIMSYDKIREIVVMGHGIVADQQLLKAMLDKCCGLRKVTIFSYTGESSEDWERKYKFFQPYCKNIRKRMF